ncbi:MAG: hypothetical protein MUE81_16750 [Thermoflexibacter sp.]|nr:hypothetical protein [Thermoflexibacter sp.]
MTQHRHQNHQSTKNIYLIINSFCAYLTMAILLIYGYYFSQMIIANTFDIQSILYFDRIDFISPSEMWSQKLILVSYTMPIIYSFITSILFFYIYESLRRQPYLIRLYCLWGHIISVSLFFCSFVHGAFAYKSFAVIFRWFYVAEKWNYFIAVFGIIGLCIMGLYMGNWFLKMAPSKEFDVHKKPRKFLLTIAALPFAVASLLISFVLIVKLENSIPLIIIQLGIALMLFFTILRAEPLHQRIVLVKDSATGKFSLLAVVSCLWIFALAIYLTYKGLSL